ncbi:MAG: membrane protein insertion efficiency factor YidD [Sediminibacterium sp.]|nr:membrane protein insertion efficiency factor YidD [Sediminibacterium sp.]
MLIRFYQTFISPLFPNQCRFTPTCSVYFLNCLKQFGIFKGTAKGIKRLLRCNPWGGSGHDPVN